MTEDTKSPDFERDKRRFSVSANRGLARARVRYVETGGAAVDTEECTFCQAVPVAGEEADASARKSSGAGYGASPAPAANADNADNKDAERE